MSLGLAVSMSVPSFLPSSALIDIALKQREKTATRKRPGDSCAVDFANERTRSLFFFFRVCGCVFTSRKKLLGTSDDDNNSKCRA